ncbi:MAG: Bug family tripartite tricarboxylate transporter substrate binding protein [Burkholderiales bacterium]
MSTAREDTVVLMRGFAARRVWSTAALVCCMLVATLASAADPWPNRPLRVIVPYGVGGSYDAIARVASTRLAEQIGQPVIVDNRAGAAGRIAMELAAKSPSDGYTLVVIGNSQTIVPSVYANVPYDLARDFDYVSMVASVANALLVNPSVPAQTMSELVALSRAKPGTIRFGSGGTGSSGHLACELIRSMTGADFTHVPYKGAALAVTGLLGNEVQMYVSNLVNALPQVQSGKLRALAVTGIQRSPLLPNVPTLDETVAKGYDIIEFHGMAMPRKTPAAIVARLNKEIAKVLASPETRTRFSTQGADPAPSTPQAFERFVLAEQAKYGKIVRSIGLKPGG